MMGAGISSISSTLSVEGVEDSPTSIIEGDLTNVDILLVWEEIDQLCVLLQGLRTGIQIITLSKTWIKPDRSDSEYEILGDRLF